MGGKDVDVGGTLCAGGSETPGRQELGLFFPSSIVGNKCSGQSTSSAVLSHIGTEAKRSNVPSIPLSRNTLKMEPMEKVNQGSTIKLHDYKVPCHPILSMPLSTLRTPPGSHVADCRKHDNLQDHGNAGSQSTRLSVFPYTLHILFIMCCLP